MDDENVTEVSWDGEPEKIVKERITPKALRRLYAQLDSDNPLALDKAIEKAISIDKRLRKDDKGVMGGNTLALVNIPPEYLREVLGGVRGVFGNGNVEGGAISGPPTTGGEAFLHGDGVETPSK